jgi:hypothetical protein
MLRLLDEQAEEQRLENEKHAGEATPVTSETSPEEPITGSITEPITESITESVLEPFTDYEWTTEPTEPVEISDWGAEEVEEVTEPVEELSSLEDMDDGTAALLLTIPESVPEETILTNNTPMKSEFRSVWRPFMGNAIGSDEPFILIDSDRHYVHDVLTWRDESPILAFRPGGDPEACNTLDDLGDAAMEHFLVETIRDVDSRLAKLETVSDNIVVEDITPEPKTIDTDKLSLVGFLEYLQAAYVLPHDQNEEPPELETETIVETKIPVREILETKPVEHVYPELFANCDRFPVSGDENLTSVSAEPPKADLKPKTHWFGRGIALLSGVAVSALSGYISVLGVGALFPGGGILVKAMGAAMEIGKVVLVANMRNVSRASRLVVVSMIVGLMSITALGVYGFLSAAHQSSKETVITSSVAVDTLDADMALIQQRASAANQVIKRLDAVEDGYLSLKMLTKAAAIHAQNADLRAKAEADIAKANADQEKLLSARASAKVITETGNLSPIRYAASALGWDEDRVVRVVIMILMLAFDPLGLMLIAVAAWRKR